MYKIKKLINYYYIEPLINYKIIYFLIFVKLNLTN